MKVKFKKTFMKDLEKLPKSNRKNVENLVFTIIPAFENLNQISNMKKIKGFDKFYRIRIGEYRIGFELRDDILVFYRVLHRKDIYRYFP